MKTTELEGAKLDYWVAKAEGYFLSEDGRDWLVPIPESPSFVRFKVSEFTPSSQGAYGEPIIESERIATFPSKTAQGTVGWTAIVESERHIEKRGDWYERPTEPGEIDNPGMGYGPTPLIAAMRAFVASKFGEEVPDA